MPLFDMASQTDAQNQENAILSNPENLTPLDAPKPGFFEGSGTAAWHGYKNAALNLINLGAEMGHKSGFIGDESIKTFDDAFLDVKKQLSPDPKVTGFLGQVLHPVTTMLGEAIPSTLIGGPAAGAIVTGGAEAYAKRKELIGEGVDEKTAEKVGAITGVTAGLGVVLPAAIPGKLATRVASGVAMNVGIGAGQRGATGKALRDNGYNAMADQYKVLDGTAILTDAVLGGAFGALSGAPRIKDPLPSEVDTALAGNNIHQLEIESAPGIPADMKTRNSHVEAMNAAAEQVYRNEPVEIGGHFENPEFVAKEFNPEIMDAIHKELGESGIYDLEQRLRAEGQKESVESKLLQEETIRLEKRPDTLLQFLSKRGGLKDVTGELEAMGAQEWHKERGNKFQRKLISEQGEHLDDALLAAWENGYFPEFSERPEINNLYDKMAMELNGRKQYPDNFIEKISEDPEYINHLAERMSQSQSDRLNSEIAEHHLSEFEEVERLEKEWYASKGDAWEPEQIENVSLEDLENEYRQENATLSTQTGEAVNGESRSAGETTGIGEESISQRGGGSESSGRSGEEIQPEVTLATEIAIEKPNLNIVDEEGNVVPASEALAKVNEEVAQAKKDSSLFEVAVNCFIRNGS